MLTIAGRQRRTMPRSGDCILYATHLGKIGGGETILLTLSTGLAHDRGRAVVLCLW